MFCTGIFTIVLVLFVEQTSPSPLCLSSFVWSPLPGGMDLLLGCLFSVPIIFLSLFTLIPCSPNYHSFILSLEIRSCLCCSRPLEFSIGIVQSACCFLNKKKNPGETLIRITLTLGITQGSLIFDIPFVTVTIW